MARIGLFAVIVIVLAVSFEQALAIKCYQCNHSTEGCSDPFKKDKLTATECSPIGSAIGGFVGQAANAVSGPQVCFKSKVSSTGHLLRGCAAKATNVVCQQIGGGETGDICETCETDECNGSAQYTPIVAMIAIPAMVIMKMYTM